MACSLAPLWSTFWQAELKNHHHQFYGKCTLMILLQGIKWLSFTAIKKFENGIVINKVNSSLVCHIFRRMSFENCCHKVVFFIGFGLKSWFSINQKINIGQFSSHGYSCHRVVCPQERIVSKVPQIHGKKIPMNDHSFLVNKTLDFSSLEKLRSIVCTMYTLTSIK